MGMITNEDDIIETFLKPRGPEQEIGLYFHPARVPALAPLSWKRESECKACGARCPASCHSTHVWQGCATDEYCSTWEE